MNGAIMQPYFLPYIGYFQLIASVEQFILYDNIKYTKKGWINRNRMLLNGTDTTFSLPLKKGADSLNIVERELSLEFDRSKLLKKFKGAYNRAPYFDQTYSVLERIIRHQDANLFRYIHHSIVQLCEHLDIKTKIQISSEIAIDHNLKSQNKVLALCKATGINNYINTIGGIDLYSKDDFRIQDINLQFIKTYPFEYAQFGMPFIPWLSIIDVLMFNPIEDVIRIIRHKFELI